MLDGIDNLREMSLRLNIITPNFQTNREITGIAEISISRREQRLNDGPIYHMILRRKPQK